MRSGGNFRKTKGKLNSNTQKTESQKQIMGTIMAQEMPIQQQEMKGIRAGVNQQKQKNNQQSNSQHNQHRYQH